MERKLLMGYYANHHALRKDIERLKTVVTNFDSYSKDDWKKINQWFDYHSRLVHYHHTGEDEFFFPWIKQRSEKFTADLKLMDEHHHFLNQFNGKLKGVINRLANGEATKQELEQALLAYDRMMTGHLDMEEQLVGYALTNVFTKEEVYKAEDEYAKKMTSVQMRESMPWMLDVMDEDEKKQFFFVTPFFVKWIYQWIAKPKFEKMVNF